MRRKNTPITAKSRSIAKRTIHAPGFLNEPIEYNKAFSRGIRIESGETTTIFISGTASIDEKGRVFGAGNFFTQVKRTFDNITALLEPEGADWHDIVQTRCYLKDMRDYDKFNTFRSSFYNNKRISPFPASVCIQAELCRPELLVEIEAIAVFVHSKNTKKKKA